MTGAAIVCPDRSRAPPACPLVASEPEVEAGLPLDGRAAFKVSDPPTLYRLGKTRNVPFERFPDDRIVDAVVDVCDQDPIRANVVLRDPGHVSADLGRQLAGGVADTPDDCLACESRARSRRTVASSGGRSSMIVISILAVAVSK